MENTKNNKLVIILLVILVLILGCLCVLFATGTIKLNDKKGNNTEEKENQTTEENKQENNNEQETSTDDYYKNLVSKYVDDTDLRIAEIKNNGLNDNVKVSLIISKVKSDKKVKCGEAFGISDEDFYNLFDGSAFGCIGHDERDAISYEIVNEKSRELFNSDAPKTYSLWNYGYSAILNSYVEVQRYGSDPYYQNFYKVVSTNTDNNKLYVTVKFIDYYYWGDIVYFINNDYEPAHVETYEELQQVFNNNLDNLPTITFVFEKVNGNYILTSVQ